MEREAITSVKLHENIDVCQEENSMIMKISWLPASRLVDLLWRSTAMLVQVLAVVVGLLALQTTASTEEVKPVGNLFLIDNISPPAVAESPSGTWNNGNDFAVVWRDNYEGQTPFDALVRVFDIDGGNPSAVQLANSRVAAEEVRWPDVAASSMGYVISLADDSDVQGLFDVYVVGANPDGTIEYPQASPINLLFVDVTTASPAIGANDDDLFLVAWGDIRHADPGGAPNLRDIYARRVNASAEIVNTDTDTDFFVNDFFPDTFAETPDIGANAGGDHLVVWSDDRVLLDTGGGEFQPRFDIYARMVPQSFNPRPEDDPQGPNYLETPVYPVSAADDGYPIHALLPSMAYGEGFFVVAWEDGGDIYARALNSAGIPLYTEFPVNDPPGGTFNAVQPSVVHFGSGRFAILWRDTRDDGSLRVRMYKPEDHLFISGDIPALVQVNDNAYPAAAATNLGRFLAVWQGPTTDAHVFGHLFDLRKLGDLTGEGDLDGLDLICFSPTWNPEGAEPVDTAGDIDEDGDVDQDDLLLFENLYQYDRTAVQKPIAAPRKPLPPSVFGVKAWKTREPCRDLTERTKTPPLRKPNRGRQLRKERYQGNRERIE
jgi:hypothetical protein